MKRILIGVTFALFAAPVYSGTDYGCVNACTSSGILYDHCRSACSWPDGESSNKINPNNTLPVVQSNALTPQQLLVLKHHPREMQTLEILLQCLRSHPDNFADYCGN